MNIWNLHSTIPTTFLLWRTKGDEFRVVQQGNPVSLLTNSDYILLDEKYKPILDKLSDQLTQRPAIIVDQVRELKWDNFIEIEILNEIDPGQIDQDDSSGLKIWKYSNEYVFVSESLKTEIEKLNEQDLGFSFRLSNFAGLERSADKISGKI